MDTNEERPRDETDPAVYGNELADRWLRLWHVWEEAERGSPSSNRALDGLFATGTLLALEVRKSGIERRIGRKLVALATEGTISDLELGKLISEVAQRAGARAAEWIRENERIIMRSKG